MKNNQQPQLNNAANAILKAMTYGLIFKRENEKSVLMRRLLKLINFIQLASLSPFQMPHLHC